MKKTTLIACAALGSAALLTGCIFPRYTDIGQQYPPEAPAAAAESMTLEQASALVKNMIADPPAGHHPNHPGDRALGKYTTAIRLRRHNRTGLVLVEVMRGRNVSLEFYVNTKADGEKFAAAVWRLRREYADK